jgi:hypothetical protein
MFKKLRDIIEGPCARDNLRGQKSLGPLKMSLEMAHKVIVPKKIMSQSFLNSGTLIVIVDPLFETEKNIISQKTPLLLMISAYFFTFKCFVVI